MTSFIHSLGLARIYLGLNRFLGHLLDSLLEGGGCLACSDKAIEVLSWLNLHGELGWLALYLKLILDASNLDLTESLLWAASFCGRVLKVHIL